MKDTDHCKWCGKERPAVAVTHNDPYCSSTCCRRDHGLEATEPGGRKPTMKMRPMSIKKRGYPSRRDY